MRPRLTEEVRASIDRVVRGDLTPVKTTETWPGVYTGGRRYTLPGKVFPVPPMLRWLLEDYVGAPDIGKGEKVAWELLFSFRGTKCAVALQKFGLGLYVDGELDEDEADRLAEELQRRLSAALKVAERGAFAAFADDQLSRGRITINNQSGRLRAMYEHFRALAVAPPEPSDDEVGEGLIAPTLNRAFLIDARRFYNAVAMINAYFSWLEHVLVLVWPMMQPRPDIGQLGDFIGKRWRDKYRTVFDVSTPGQAKVLFDQLCEVSEEYRNTYAHGGFDKRNSAFLIHSDLGAMPAVLSDVRGDRHFGLVPIPQPTVESVTSLFEELDAWLRTGPSRYGMQYAEAGFDLPVSDEHLNEAAAAMTSEAGFEEWLNALGHQIDRISNMDW